ncbi:hypothetical protein [Fischerella sp. PCC 9605]
MSKVHAIAIKKLPVSSPWFLFYLESNKGIKRYWHSSVTGLI